MTRWRRVEHLPIALDHDDLAVRQYIVTALGDALHSTHKRTYGASTRDEAQSIAARLRSSDAQIVTIARVEDAWKRQ